MFDSTKEDLLDILRQTDEGQLQLPDFQRDYVWNDEDVRNLIASVARGFPVGALLTLETGGDVRFKPRLLESVPDNGNSPMKLLLDGQQRITSLYQSMFSSEPVRTRSERGRGEVRRFYYLDIKKSLDGKVDLVDTIISVPEDRIRRTDLGKKIDLDLSEPSKEYANDMFPLNLVFKNKDWLYGWRDYWREQGKGEKIANLQRDFDKKVIEEIERYEMPLIQLKRETSREAICLIFEKVNVGGKKLDAFELLTAIFAGNRDCPFDLREDWFGSKDKSVSGRKNRIINSPIRCHVLEGITSTDFLKSCTLLHTREHRLMIEKHGKEGREYPQISCKRDALLNLSLDGYKSHADSVEKGMIEASMFLNEQKFFWYRDIPYPTLIIGLASVFAILGKKAQTTTAKQKVSRWFWAITLGELFGSSTDTRLARDIPELVGYILEGGDYPQAFDEAVFQQKRLRSLRTRISAAYKGIHALVMRQGCRDFIANTPTDIMTFYDHRIDIHHIFPRAWCKKQNIDSRIYNSIVNKTPLRAETNRFIGGQAPSVYLRKIEEQRGVSSTDLDSILDSHLIDSEHLRNDDFDAFFDARSKALSDLVGRAMEKAVVAEEMDETDQEHEFDSGDELAEEAAYYERHGY